MSLLFETIRVVNGVSRHLEWHEARMNHARHELWKSVDPLFLEPAIRIPEKFSSGVVRCNIYYGPEIQEIRFGIYEPRLIRSLKLLKVPCFDYHLKYTDRSILDSFLGFRGTCDEIIMVQNGLITDTSISNLIFFDGKEWFTPANPILKGTCRNRLMAEGRLIAKEIRIDDLDRFIGCKMINSMRDPEEERLIAMSEIT